MGSIKFTKKNMILLNNLDIVNNKIKHASFKGKAGMFVIYQDWCGYCHQLADPWILLHKIGGADFPVAAIDGNTYNGSIQIKGFPTIMTVSKTGIFKMYTGSRDIDTLMSEMCKLYSSHKLCKKLK